MAEDNLVDRVAAVFRQAGLPAHADAPASGGFGVQAPAPADPAEVGAYVVWNASDELNEPAFARLLDNDLEHPSVLHMGRTLEAMAEAMLAILASAGLNARMSGDDLAPATVVVYQERA